MFGPGLDRFCRTFSTLCQEFKKFKLRYGEGSFCVKFVGPKDTLYDGGHYKVNIQLPDKYPFKSPSIGFANRIYHPNIDESSGSICLDVLNQTWTPLYSLVNIFEVR